MPTPSEKFYVVTCSQAYYPSFYIISESELHRGGWLIDGSFEPHPDKEYQFFEIKKELTREEFYKLKPRS